MEHIAVLKTLGYRIVLVTGALDFQIAPLARDIDAGISIYPLELQMLQAFVTVLFIMDSLVAIIYPYPRHEDQIACSVQI